MSEELELATLGGGCFWCVEVMYQDLKGVKKVISGYTGGHVDHPTYEQICTGTTGHAEVIQITFDPSIITYEAILKLFWKVHDPTTLNQQGADRGTQYRSSIFCHSEQQKEIAEQSKKETDASGLWPNRIVTEITMISQFFEAEDYHQDYYNQNSNQPYCQMVIVPKLQKFKQELSHLK